MGLSWTFFRLSKERNLFIILGQPKSHARDTTDVDQGEQRGTRYLRSRGVYGVFDSDDFSQKGDKTAQSTAETEREAGDIAVAAEWNAIRTRLRDPVILGHAGAFADGAAVAAHIFERFETASGEHNAHEVLEETSEDNYVGFEDGLGDLRTALEAADLDGAHEAMKTADQHLKAAQRTLVGSETLPALDVLVMGAHVEDAALLTAVGAFEEAADELSHIGDRFAESGLREMVADVDADAADSFTEAVDRAATAASNEQADTTAARAREAVAAAAQGSYALVSPAIAGAAHVGALQARGSPTSA